MTLRTISLIVFDSREAEWLIPQATEMAYGFDAHLTVLHAYKPVVYYAGVGAPPMVYPTLETWKEEESAAIRALFEDKVRANGIQAEFRAQRDLSGSERFLLSAVRATDLVLAGTSGTDGRSADDKALLERLIRTVGRPVLVLVPEATIAGPIASVTAGWSDTREAARAIHDALPLLTPKAEIELVSVVSRASELSAGIDSKDDLAAALSRRGYQVTVTDRNLTAESRADELAEAARNAGSQMLVAGAFGHSQLYDFVVGAVTGELLEKARLPVLLSH